MNKRITNKVAKRRANSPEAVELRRLMLEIAGAVRDFAGMETRNTNYYRDWHIAQKL